MARQEPRVEILAPAGCGADNQRDLIVAVKIADGIRLRGRNCKRRHNANRRDYAREQITSPWTFALIGKNLTLRWPFA
jgi:hypothetical protein